MNIIRTKPIYVVLALALIFLLYIAAVPGIKQSKEWLAPEEANEIENPQSGDIESAKEGKKLFGQQCWTCHGTMGKGDGPASARLNPSPADFSTDIFQSQTDGAIFWKISEGRGNMAAYKHALSTDNRWALVNYIRNLK